MAFGELFLAALRKGRAEPLPPGQPFPSLPGNGGTGRPPGCLPPPRPRPRPPLPAGAEERRFGPGLEFRRRGATGRRWRRSARSHERGLPAPLGLPGFPRDTEGGEIPRGALPDSAPRGARGSWCSFASFLQSFRVILGVLQGCFGNAGFPSWGSVPLWGQTSDPRRERASGGAGRPGAAFPLFSPCSFLLFLSFYFSPRDQIRPAWPRDSAAAARGPRRMPA